MAPSRVIHPVSVHAVLGVCWAACLVALAAAGPGNRAFASQNVRPAENGYAYYYFKEQCRLPLDTSRIAILGAMDGPGTVLAESQLSAYGLDGSTIEAMAVRGWSFVKTTASVQTDSAIRHAVSGIAGAESFEFVSPVFLDDDNGPIVVTPYILVGFDRSLDSARAEAILAESGVGAVLDRDWAGMQRTYRLKSASRDGFEVLATANRLAQRPELAFAEPDLLTTVHPDLFPNDPYFPYMWGLHNDGSFIGTLCTLDDFDMDAPEAWDVTTGDPSIVVVILDDGIQPDHPDLNLYTPGFDATGQGSDGAPVNACDNHGTTVAGCISGIINNEIGIVGVAPGVKTACARVGVSHVPCDNLWTSTASWVVDALAWAESIGARITNSSWSRSPSSAITQKFADTRANGMLHFGAAGNESSNLIDYPASLTSVNAVAALEPCGGRAPFSNYGVGLAFSAPGHYLISTDRTGTDGYNDGIDDGACTPEGAIGCNTDEDCGPEQTCFLVSIDYALVVGTSYASPYAAGVAALALSVNPGLTADQLETLLQMSAVDLGPAGYDINYGWGFVNAANLVAGTTSVVAPGVGSAGFALRSHPNPFAAGTSIEYDLGRESVVQIRIFDVSGRIVRATSAHSEGPGPHAFLWDGTGGAGAKLPAGMYLLEVSANGESQTRKILMLH